MAAAPAATSRDGCSGFANLLDDCAQFLCPEGGDRRCGALCRGQNTCILYTVLQKSVNSRLCIMKLEEQFVSFRALMKS